MRLKTKKTKRSSGYRNNIFFIVMTVMLIFFVVNLFVSWRKNLMINNEIDTLQVEIADLEKQNFELTGLIQYFNSQAFIEEKARVDLGLKKEDEKMVIVADSYKEQFKAEKMVLDKQKEDVTLNNPQKWYRYFFN